MNQKTRAIIGFLILCGCTVGILYAGPDFNFVLQVLAASFLLFFLFWMTT